MNRGKLYNSNDEQLVGEVNYRLHKDSPTNWWGELILVEYKRISDGGDYIIELEDKRRGRCHLKQRVNRAVSGTPPRYTYRFTGSGLLK
jgi:hypothetical protein